ncbi:MAG: NDP-sugar synthase [Planctomyces sp.]|jgi:NDP-sugar pyrophosphorylase family protein
MTSVGKGGAAGLRAVILAGGRGTRLRPFTASFPKPLVPLGDTPVVEVLIRRLLEFGITDITLTLGHLAELMQAYFLQRRELTSRLSLQFVVETAPTGTAGSLSLIEGLDQTFLVMNGDLLTDIDFHALVNFHREQGALLTVAAHRRHVKVDLGVLEINSDHRIVDYHEKPEKTYDVSMGIYVYEPAVLKWIPQGQHLDLPGLVLKLLQDGQKVCAWHADCQWLDIGRPDDYARAQELFGDGRAQFESI